MLMIARKCTIEQELEALMTSIQLACKTISSLVSRAGITDLTGLSGGGGSVNIQVLLACLRHPASPKNMSFAAGRGAEEARCHF
jgi:hypothetical protein